MTSCTCESKWARNGHAHDCKGTYMFHGDHTDILECHGLGADVKVHAICIKL